ncbi:hypothetical protein R6Q57_003452 [Mikania cordata]
MPNMGCCISRSISAKKGGMSLKDAENDAHKIYEQESGYKFTDSIKWDLQLNYDTTHSRRECEMGNEESGGSTKRSKLLKKGTIVSIPTTN